jgi:putative Holliday junction resolvase
MESAPQRQQPPPAPRILAVDPGERRTGVALSDELGLFAHPRRAITASNPSALADAIARLTESEQAAEVVVGLPLSMSGGESQQTARSRALVMALRQRLQVPVTAWDERLSSTEAARRVPSKRHRTGELDSEAASIILQAVLDSRRGALAQ